MSSSKCQICALENSSSESCSHDDNTVFLMAVWLKTRPQSLLEFYICVYHELSLLDTEKDIYKSIDKFVEYYKLFQY